MRILAAQTALKDMATPYEGHDLQGLCSRVDTGQGEAIHVFGACSSTLDVAWELIQSGTFAIWDSVVASSQWAGRGQTRRRWLSPAGNLYAAWRWPVPPQAWNTLVPLMVGWGIRDFFHRLGIELRIKWPNDLLLEGRKVGGILVEERKGALVVGVGLNVTWSPDPGEMRAESSITAGNLSGLLSDANSLELWAQLVSRVRFWYEKTLASCTPAEFVSLLEPCLAFMYHHVQVVSGDGRHLARVIGLQEDGGLVLDRQGQRDILYSGSILPLDEGQPL
ncbi:biotin--[acetyl-CoA-carboxylase] ligase [Desulfoplanes formicivorans]|uniref:Biotin--[acetyl-CoA-carboxylase] ligase n=1 Tax=Desulfoplanes formicivorans TaxID=1592317 RepID=A0A194ADU7_9BACT|nr:biotin--[acetyl-CoA-carboxylase] ligase [Desulfoplanes formicivorans]GAU08252.1 biotin--[acetyl-CoA-carboxylase] ligase [Desulfoplanes formicivorans]